MPILRKDGVENMRILPRMITRNLFNDGIFKNQTFASPLMPGLKKDGIKYMRLCQDGFAQN